MSSDVNTLYLKVPCLSLFSHNGHPSSGSSMFTSDSTGNCRRINLIYNTARFLLVMSYHSVWNGLLDAMESSPKVSELKILPCI